jgi:hypothetical protein
MSSILPLGRTMNFGRNASAGTTRVALRDCSGIGFLVDTPAAASTLTVTEQTAATGGTSQAIAGGLTAGSGAFVFTQVSGVWTRQTTGIAANVVTVSGTPDLLYVWVPQGLLSDGFAWLVGAHSAKITTYVLGDLDVSRGPASLRNYAA